MDDKKGKKDEKIVSHLNQHFILFFDSIFPDAEVVPAEDVAMVNRTLSQFVLVQAIGCNIR